MLTQLVAQSKSLLTIHSQKDRLMQYVGVWYSSVNTDTDSLAAIPQLKMICKKKLNGTALSVEVFQRNDNEYRSILYEMICYDQTNDSISAYGQNQKGELFLGSGQFLDDKNWVMYDKTLKGKDLMSVKFLFNDYTDVTVEGFDKSNNSLWKTRYIKQNPKDKNIGIQLVSVHKSMLVDPKGTLKQLSRFGYSYIETFVYSNGNFYGMTPEEFRGVVEKEGMQFLGSMTFYDLPKGNHKAAEMWWQRCIDDHKKAGVKYLSTSNDKLKEIKSKNELKAYCDYYNMVGKLCKANGIRFIFHNHADEFLFVDGIRIYDYFLENTDPSYVYFQTDLYWMKVGGVNPIDYFNKYPNRFISWHVKDYMELGQSGKIDFKEIFKHTDIAGLEYTVAEVEKYNFPPLYGVQLAFEYLYYQILK